MLTQNESKHTKLITTTAAWKLENESESVLNCIFVKY